MDKNLLILDETIVYWIFVRYSKHSMYWKNGSVPQCGIAKSIFFYS